MKTLRTYLRPVAYALTLLILFQGCTVYRSQGVTLDQAVYDGKKVKLVTNQDKVIKCKRIELENGLFYGVTKVKKEDVRTPINAEQVKTIRPENEIVTALIIFPIIPLSVLGILFSFCLIEGCGYF